MSDNIKRVVNVKQKIGTGTKVVVFLLATTILSFSVYKNGTELDAATIYKYGTSPDAINAPSTPVVYAFSGSGSTTSGQNTSPFYSIPSSFTFTKSMGQGDSINPDVAYLQRVLNSSPATRVATSAAGSDSNLTTYFGPKTLDAVIRFQNLYRSEILTPANITEATGFVGMFTLKKLNALLKIGMQNGIYSPVASATTTTSSQTAYVATNGNSSINYGARQITDLSTYNATPGQTMSLYGQGLHPTVNKLYLGTVYAGAYPSQNLGTKITFKVPASISQGRYQLQINNEYGTTTSSLVFLNINSGTDTNTNYSSYSPTLTNITPTSTSAINSVIRMTGTNFTSNNSLLTNLGDITNIRSADGKNIDFMVGSFPFYTNTFNANKGKSFVLKIKIKNEYGISAELSHTLYFPNTNTPTINTSDQIISNLSSNTNTGSGSAISTSYNSSLKTYLSGGAIIPASTNYSTYDNSSQTINNTTSATSVTTTSANTTGTNTSNNETSSLDQYKPPADPLLDLARQIDPALSFITDPLVSDVSLFSTITGGSNSSSGSNGSSSSSSLTGVATLAGGLGIAALLGGGGSSAASGATAASAASSMGYFGGIITRVQICTCSGQTLLTVQDYATNAPVMSMYIPGLSKLNANFNIWTPSTYVIAGTYQGTAQCQVLRYAGVTAYCNTEGTSQSIIDTIRGIGSSGY